MCLPSLTWDKCPYFFCIEKRWDLCFKENGNETGQRDSSHLECSKVFLFFLSPRRPPPLLNESLTGWTSTDIDRPVVNLKAGLPYLKSISLNLWDWLIIINCEIETTWHISSTDELSRSRDELYRALRSSHYCFLVSISPWHLFFLWIVSHTKAGLIFSTPTGPLAVGTGSDESPRHPASPKDSDYKAALISWKESPRKTREKVFNSGLKRTSCHVG